jgi:hypothetical protein
MRVAVMIVLVALAVAGPRMAAAQDGPAAFARWSKIASLQVGGGAHTFERGGQVADVSFLNVTPRLSVFPFEPFGSSWWKGALETGIEGWLQYYLEPSGDVAGGLKLAGRYHFIGIGALVPYVEALGGAGGSSLTVLGHHSAFTFVLEGGAGVSYFLTPMFALTAGYRFQHLSNGGTDTPNRSYNAHTGTVGVSYAFR